MEAYPPELLSHLVPLVTIQGLDTQSSKAIPSDNDNISSNPLIQDGEALFRKQSPIAELPFVEDVVKVWRKYHVDGVMWDSSSTKTQIPTHPHRYRFKTVDTAYTLPKKVAEELSPLSIQTESSPVFPDGILTTDWVQKYRSIVPCIFISFYELDASLNDAQDIERVDNELASEINILKDQLVKRNIKLLAVVVSAKSTAMNPELNERVNTIRKMTGLNSRNGLVFLPSATPKEVTAFANEVLQIIKPASTEFYGALEKRLRRKRAKALSAVPMENIQMKDRTEARYSLKLGIVNEIKQQYDYSVKAFETAYQSLVDVLNDLPATDKHWKPFRLLLDFTIFHIVRLNLYLEQTNTAYKKFDVHIQSVMYFLKLQKISPDSYEACDWLSQQFKWLAQLSDLAPVTLVPSDVPFKPDPSRRLSPIVLPHAGYLYLQAADILRRRERATDKPTEDFQETLINLLTFAKLAFQKRDNTFTRSISYINYQLAEEHYQTEHYDRAYKLYEQSLDTLKEDEWNDLLTVIHCRLFECCLHLKKYYPSVLNLLEISLSSNKPTKSAIDKVKELTSETSGYKQFLDGEKDIVVNASSDSSFDLFECEVLFKSTRVPLTNNAEFQIKIKSKLNDVMDVTVLDDVLISFEGAQSPILLKNSGEEQHKHIITVSKVTYNEEKDCFIADFDLSFRAHEEKILKVVLPTKKVGRNTCSTISGVMRYHDYFKVNINIPMVTSAFQYRHVWYDDSGVESIVATPDPALCEVIPRVPDTKVTVEGLPNFVVPGEKVPLKVKVYNTDHETVDVTVEAKLIYGQAVTACVWDDSEETRDLEIKSVETEKDIVHDLLFVVPDKVNEDVRSQVKLSVKTSFVVNGDDDVPIFQVQKFDMALIEPFHVSLNILPRLKSRELPKVFEIEERDVPVPKPSRYWLMRASIMESENHGLELVDDELKLHAEDEHMVCHEDVEKKSKKKTGRKVESDHYVETLVEGTHSLKNIAFEATMVLKWKRPDSETIHEYKHEPWKLSLPLLDPRVLLDIEPSEGKDNDLKLTYMLENPTSRVFSFSTTLIENHNFQVTGTKSLSQVSVLPCTRQELVFHATPLVSGWVPLPQLKVYDLNYRVNLPTLPITDMAQTHKSEVYVNVEDS